MLNMLKKRPAATAALTLILIAAPATAFILPVIDPASIAKEVITNSSLARQIVQYAQMIGQYAQIITTTEAQFKMWTQSLKKLGSRKAWETAALNQLHSNVGNTYGETAQLNSVLNGKPLFTLDDVWKKATLAMNGTAYMSSDTPGSSGHLANTAGIEMTDGFSVDALNAISTYRQNEQQNVAAINDLQHRTESTDDDDNTLTAQQNLTNAAIMQSIKLQESANSINTAMLEQLTVQNTWNRNAAAELSNIYATRSQLATSNPSDYTNAGNTLRNFIAP